MVLHHWDACSNDGLVKQVFLSWRQFAWSFVSSLYSSLPRPFSCLVIGCLNTSQGAICGTKSYLLCLCTILWCFWIICWCVQPILTYGIVRFPLFMNAFQFCVIDTFIKFEKKQYCTREKKLLTLPPPAIRKSNANRNTHVATATAAAVTAAFTETTPLLPM